MFEALFILTTLDAGTRVGRYILQDALGHLWKPLGDTKALGPNLLASGLMVAGWGTFLIQGVRDPLGGINSLWPLFGIANQMLAAIALCLATTIILKMALAAPSPVAVIRKPWFALVTLIPLIWLLSVTFTAGIQKVWHPDPRIGFLSQIKSLEEKITNPGSTAQSVDPQWLAQKRADNKTWTTQQRNAWLDVFVAVAFLVLVSAVVLLSVWEWISLLSKRKPAVLRESEPHWLPDYAVTEPGAKLGGVAGTAALTIALAKELSGESHLERARQEAAVCDCADHQHAAKSDEQIYVETTERRFTGVRRCC
jgi:carbon starvation protein